MSRRQYIACEFFGVRLDNGTDAIEIESQAFLRNAYPLRVELFEAGAAFVEPLVGLAVLHPHLNPPRQLVELGTRTTDNLQALWPFVVPAGAKLSIIMPGEAFKRALAAKTFRTLGLLVELPESA